MIIIGVNGDVGAGKSTLSETLFFGTDRVVVHLDHIFDRILALMPKALLPSVHRDNGEDLRIMSKDSPIRKITGNKYVSQIMWFYARKVLEGLINKYEKAGFEYFIIEGIYLEKCTNLDDFDYTIFVNAPTEIRYERVINRNTKDELAIRGNNATEKNDVHPERYDLHVENSGSLDDYLEKIEAVEKQILSKINTRSRV